MPPKIKKKVCSQDKKAQHTERPDTEFKDPPADKCNSI